ncbi:GIY-YIG nuclease family protein [Chitinispirillales bacterium ANBcel5]|uniref:GIY-YIG nuclease family protein n=1 Tax=Cellulosispirillum alkaliphilum TaxID=3039283 RepID=UPI002A5688EE|nr:GIY-YIG nuclease family protein [Chitinispirillales bacterium ANBcel5]
MTCKVKSSYSNPYYLYVVRTKDNYLYTGITTNIKRRFGEHLSTTKRRAKFFHSHPPLRVEFSVKIGNRSLAQKVEYHFKRLSRSKKNSVISSGYLPFDLKSGKIL